MNGVPGLIIALLLPWLLGYSLVKLIWRDAVLSAKLGYGYFLGIFATTTVLYFYGSAGLTLEFWPIALILVMLTIGAYFFSTKATSPNPHPPPSTLDCGWQQWLWWFFLTLLIIRFSGLALEEFWRPLYPWDAWTNWSPKAKTWFELKQLVPYVHPDNWPIESMQSGAYTLANPKASTYPPLVPLVQLWTAMGLGEWRDNWINLPWLLAGIAMGFAFYGQMRILHINPLWSIFSVYLLFSIPYLNAHVALAGYAELWVAGFYALGIMALANWALTGRKAQLSLVIIMAIACVFTKKPGLAWAMTLFLGILINLIPLRFRYASILSIAGGSILWLLSRGIEAILTGWQQVALSPSKISIPGFIDFSVQYHPVGQYFAHNGLVQDNWHLMGWLGLLLSLPLAITMLRRKELIPLAVTLASGVLFIVFVFFFTEHYSSAMDSTTINRAVFHFLPSLFFLSATIAFHAKHINNNLVKYETR